MQLFQALRDAKHIPSKQIRTLCVEITLCRPKNTYPYQIKDTSSLRRWIFFIFSPIINKTIGLKLL